MGQNDQVTASDVALGAVVGFLALIFTIAGIIGLILVLVTTKVLSAFVLSFFVEDTEPVVTLIAFIATLGACFLMIPMSEGRK